MKQLCALLLLLLFFSQPLFLSGETDLFEDLLLVEKIDARIHEKFPVYYNNYLQGGYINMPSALMGEEGEIGCGYSHVYPYKNGNLRFQLFNNLEISGNYRIFRGIEDPHFLSDGFGDKSDKGANVKLCLLHAKDSQYTLPSIAIGADDFLGTKGFESRYLVFTQIVPSYNLEFSLGYGKKRIRGFFGGIHWLPFRCWECSTLSPLALTAEYDAIPYCSKKREPHPEGRSKKSPINYGLKYRFWDFIDINAAYFKGERFSLAASTFYNFGHSEGFFPKFQDPLLYRAPHQKGPIDEKTQIFQLFYCPFKEQNFEIFEIWISRDHCGNTQLRLKMENLAYRYEDDLKYRIQELLTHIFYKEPLLENIDEAIIVLEDMALPIQEYRFPTSFINMYREKKLCSYELSVIGKEREFCSTSMGCYDEKIFDNPRYKCQAALLPKTYTNFGSAKGKFKYLLGVELAIDGFILSDWHYNVVVGYNITSTLDNVSSVDKNNPSKVINVRTDIVEYFKNQGICVDSAYLEKPWNLKNGWYSRCAFGLFEEAYGGIAGEILYAPIDCSCAIGIEGALLRKRTYTGVGFTNKVRKRTHGVVKHLSFYPSQYFINYYSQLKFLDLDLHLKGGKFLADDWGVRTEVGRTFSSGMRVYFWKTYTNKKDTVNGDRYHDYGLGISLPLDLFYPYSSRKKWNYSLSAWLRDIGASASTGAPLYETIRANREHRMHYFR